MVSFNAAISACEKCGQWRHAMLLLQDLEPRSPWVLVWYHGEPPMLWACCVSCVACVALGLPYKENRLGCFFGKMEGVFPVDFEGPSSSRFPITSPKKLPKLRSKAEVILCGGSSYVFLGDNCLYIALFYNYIWWWAMVFGERKRCSRSKQLLTQCGFFSKFSAAKYVTQTPFLIHMYMKSLCATSFPALACARGFLPHLCGAKGACMNHSFVQLNFQQESVGS